MDYGLAVLPSCRRRAAGRLPPSLPPSLPAVLPPFLPPLCRPRCRHHAAPVAVPVSGVPAALTPHWGNAAGPAAQDPGDRQRPDQAAAKHGAVDVQQVSAALPYKVRLLILLLILLLLLLLRLLWLRLLRLWVLLLLLLLLLMRGC